MSYQLLKPYTDKERINFIVEYNHQKGLKIEETSDALYALESNEIMQDNKPIIDPTYDVEQAKIIKNNLIENINYNHKAKIAYTGVLFDYNGIELVFETNKESMSMINNKLIQILSGLITSIDGWKCRKTIEPYEPYSVNFTVEQFNKLITFGGNMVTQAFNIETEINKQIEQLTVEQLNDKEFIINFKKQIEEIYNTIPIKIENLFIYDDEASESQEVQ